MKETLTLILQRLDTISGDVGFLKSDMADVKDDVSFLKSDMADVKDDVGFLKSDMADVKGDVSFLKSDVDNLRIEQSEMRKETAYYYSSMMKNLDDVKTELRSEMRQVVKVQQQHQDVLEFINKNQ